VKSKIAVVDPSLVLEIKVLEQIMGFTVSRFTIERDAECRDESNIYVRSTDGVQHLMHEMRSAGSSRTAAQSVRAMDGRKELRSTTSLTIHVYRHTSHVPTDEYCMSSLTVEPHRLDGSRKRQIDNRTLERHLPGILESRHNETNTFFTIHGNS
jgi:hypothetical protein